MKNRLSLFEQGYRTAVVTGASSGIGRAIAYALATEGLTITGLSRRSPEDVPKNYTHIEVDLLNPTQLERCLDRLKEAPPDIWINNAGQGLVGSAWQADDQAIQNTTRLLYEVPVKLSRFFEQCCRPHSGQPAYLVQVSSLAVELPIPAMPYYNAAKAALSGYTQSLLLDQKQNFRLIDFRPGDFNTAFMQHIKPTSERSSHGTADQMQAYHQHLHERHAKAPAPEKAAVCLIQAMRRGRSGTVRSGTFFQSKLAPLGNRLLPEAIMRHLIRSNYR